MNLVTNELAGLFLLPISTTLSVGVWDVVNGLGVVFAPFVVLIVKSFFDARAQGLDEGSPAVLAVKMVEKGFWGYLVVIMFVLTPYSSKLKVDHAQFACRDNPSLISNDLAGATEASEGALAALGVNPSVSPPLFYGFVHQVSTGINEAAISQLSCRKGATGAEVANAIDKLMPDTESLYRSAQSFDQKCFKVAQTKAQTALAQNELLRHPTNNKYGWTFHAPDFASNAQLMESVYDGSYIQEKKYSAMTMDVPDVWFNTQLKGQTADCSALAEDLYEKIEQDVRATDDFAENLEKLQNFASIMNPKVTDSEIVHDMVVKVYESTLTHKPTQAAGWSEAEDNKGWNLGSLFSWQATHFANNVHKWQASNEDFNLMNTVGSWMVTLGAVGTTISESAKSYAVALMLPLIVVIIQCVLQISLPILTVISGLSYKFLFNWFLLYFSVTLVPFWLNIGLQIETLLLSLSNYSDSLLSHAMNVRDGIDMETYLVSSTSATFVYLVPVIWVMLVQIIGNIAASSFMNAVAGAAIVGQTGADVMGDGANKVADAAGDSLGKYLRGKQSWGTPNTNWSPEGGGGKGMSIAGGGSSAPGITNKL